MPNSIINNIAAQFTANSISRSMEDLKSSAIRLSSGKQIVSASDDPAGHAIGKRIEVNRDTSETILDSTAQAKSILSIADGGMTNLSDIVSKMLARASQANSGALNSTELGYIQSEMDLLAAQIGTVVQTTSFNDTNLLDGSYSRNFQVGLSPDNVISVSFNALDANSLGIGSLNVTNDVNGAVTSLKNAITTISSAQSALGATQSRFNSASTNIENSINNLSAAASVYLDADITKVSTDFANQQVQLQAGIAALSQVNNLNSNLIKLIG